MVFIFVAGTAGKRKTSMGKNIEGKLMKRFNQLFLIAVILMLSVSVLAQDEDDDEERWRNFEVIINSGLTGPLGEFSNWNDSLDAAMGFHLAVAAGYYFTDKVCAGLYFAYTQNGIKGDLGDQYDIRFRMYDLGGYIKYVAANETNFEPFTQLSIGINTVKYPTWVTSAANELREQSYDPGLSTSLAAGLIYFTSDMGGIFLEGAYHYNFLKDAKATYSEGYIKDDISYFEINAGVTVFFGPDE
jgi:hypothetical protein